MSGIALQCAAVVGVATSAVTSTELTTLVATAARSRILFAPDDCTVTIPDELLMILDCPATTPVVGRSTVWTPPVNSWMEASPATKVVVDPVVFCVLKSSRAILALVLGNVIVVASVPARVRVLLTVRVFPSATVNVAEVAGAVIVSLLIEVALATPRVGVTNVGEDPKLVSEDAVTPDARVAPVRVPAAAATVMSALPLKPTPLIFRDVVRVAALPVVL